MNGTVMVRIIHTQHDSVSSHGNEVKYQIHRSNLTE